MKKVMTSTVKFIRAFFSFVKKLIFDLHPLYIIILLLQIIPIGIINGTDQGKEIVSIFFENFENNSSNDVIDRLSIFFFIIFFLSCYIVYIRTILFLLSIRFGFAKDEYPFHAQICIIMLILPAWIFYLFISNSGYLVGSILILVLAGFIYDFFYNIIYLNEVGLIFYKINYYKPLLSSKLKINKSIMSDGGFLSTAKIRFSFPLLVFIVTLYFFIINSFDFTYLYKITETNWLYIKWLLIIVLVPLSIFIIIEVSVYFMIISSRVRDIKDGGVSKIQYIPISKYLGYVFLFFLILPLLYRQSQSLFLLIFGLVFIIITILQLFLLVSSIRYFGDDIKVIGIVLIVFFIGSYQLKKENLHQIRYIDKEITTKQYISSDFKNWLRLKQNKPDSSRVFIIVSEGGGIRSAYWTAGLLNKIDSLYPEVMDNTYAFSGVSGGSIGGVIYYSLKSGHERNNHKWRTILGKDYLSSAIYGITIANTIQSISPFTWDKLDRGNLLEDDFSKAFFSETNTNTLDSSIQILYNKNSNINVPNLFLNTTNVESGKKMIISNLILDKDVFKNDIDFGSICTKSISLKTAGLLSARFPVVSPSALIKLDNNNNWGRILDGGFFDNSGLLTAIDIVKTMKKITPQLKPVILFIRNQNIPLNTKHNLSNDFLSSGIAFFNSWDSKTERTVNDCINSNDFDFIQLKLTYSDSLGAETDYPLGWTLSKRTQKSLDNKIKEIGTDKDKINSESWNQLKSTLLN